MRIDLVLTSSNAVIGELTRGRSEATQVRCALIESIELLSITDGILQIAQIYIDRLIMPRNPQGDALHVAIASFSSCGRYTHLEFRTYCQP